MKEATKFSRWLDKHRDGMPEDVRSLAEQARCALNQMAMDPKSNERCPQLREANLADIQKFAAAYAAQKSRADAS